MNTFLRVRDLLLTVFIVSIIGLIIFFSRQIFFFKYEPDYYEDLYYHSQWNYPQSTRGISDGELYKFVGYRLVQGEIPFNINYETPPFGKFLYGLSEMYLGNPYWVSLLFYFLSIMVLALFSYDLFKDKTKSLIAVALFACTPFVATQIRDTMLDLPLMFFYLLHGWIFIKYLNNKKVLFVVLSGFLLGLTAGVKIGAYLPFVALLELIFIYFVNKNFLNLFLYFFSIFSGYAFSYISYFIRHPNPIPWIRLHDKVLRFFTSQGAKFNFMPQFKTIFIDSFNGGSFVLPLGVIALLICLIISIRKKDFKWTFLALFTLIFLGVNNYVYFPRYLMPTVPLFILLLLYVFNKAKYLLLLLAILNVPFLIITLNNNDPTGNAQVYANFISTRAYRDFYRSLSTKQRKTISEDEFVNVNEYFFQQLEIRKIVVETKEVSVNKNKGEVKYKITYLTKYGELSFEPTFYLTRTNNNWNLDWKWDYLWPGFDKESKIFVKQGTIPFVKLVDKKGITLAQRGKGKAIYIMPRVMFNWNSILNSLCEITNTTSEEMNSRLRLSVPDKYPRFVGYIDPTLGTEGINKALAIPGVTLRDIDYIFTSTIPLNRDLKTVITDLVKNRPELFFIEADIYFDNKNKEKKYFPFPKPIEKNVVIRY